MRRYSALVMTPASGCPSCLRSRSCTSRPKPTAPGLLFIPRAKTDQEGEGGYAWVSADSMRRIAAWRNAAAIDAGFIFRRVGIERRAAVAARPARPVGDLAPNAHIDWRRMRAQNPQPARVRYVIGSDPLTRKGVNLI
jgi:hypothetical protein